MIRATLDTNTLASGVIARAGTIALIFDHWRSGNFELVISAHIVEELLRTLHKPYFAARLGVSDREGFLALVLGESTLVEVPEPIPDILPDTADSMIIVTALTANVPYVVTGDREMQRLARHRSVEVLSPRQFLAVIPAGVESPGVDRE